MRRLEERKETKRESIFLYCPLVSQGKHHLCALLLDSCHAECRTCKGMARLVLGTSGKEIGSQITLFLLPRCSL